ncbi:MAG: RNA polymerase sigma factor [Acidimicrobiia bacterium]|nr:RNA polymerase sigma factor [Acidimicrobiia bacterium]MDX2466076.1 RNA polymerase sigma factor [Acidimicrobiia bacterium]
MTSEVGLLNRRLASDLDGAFPELVTEMQGLVFNGARRWVPSRQDAEDIAQEVFVKAYKALQGYPSQRVTELRLRPWLFTITINLCRNHARTKSRRPTQTALSGVEPLAPTATEQSAVDAVTIDEWRVRLGELGTRQRDAIVLRHVVGLPYEEIAEVLGRPAGTVKSDVHRGLERLRSMLATEE